mmetsp:Transcript_54806/g.146715  ORF Transcript_54806/g.146715 Transcript_54806/m.146715 type:complete len:239 (+) Transcript_54806:97-813(+)
MEPNAWRGGGIEAADATCSEHRAGGRRLAGRRQGSEHDADKVTSGSSTHHQAVRRPSLEKRVTARAPKDPARAGWSKYASSGRDPCNAHRNPAPKSLKQELERGCLAALAVAGRAACHEPWGCDAGPPRLVRGGARASTAWRSSAPADAHYGKRIRQPELDRMHSMYRHLATRRCRGRRLGPRPQLLAAPTPARGPAGRRGGRRTRRPRTRARPRPCSSACQSPPARSCPATCGGSHT